MNPEMPNQPQQEPPREYVEDPRTGVEMDPKEWREMRENEDKNNP